MTTYFIRIDGRTYQVRANSQQEANNSARQLAERGGIYR